MKNKKESKGFNSKEEEELLDNSRSDKEKESLDSDDSQDIPDEQNVIEELSEKKTKEEILEEELTELKDKYLRNEAEIQNVRRVADQQVIKARLYGLESFAKEIFSVGDNLERALDSLNTKPDLNLAIEGIELTLRGYEKVLESAGITYINPLKEKFNADQHQAVTVVEDDKLDENTVKEVIQKGYLLYERVVRPAMVIVSKKSASKEK